MSKTNIEWTEHTWNPVTGCTRASAGCDNCYAVAMTRRLAGYGNEKYTGLVNDGKGHFNGAVKLHPDVLEEPLRRKKPTRFFVCSMSDLFHPSVPFEFVDRVFAVMALARQHTFQVLTKRPDRMAAYLLGAETVLGEPCDRAVKWMSALDSMSEGWTEAEVRKYGYAEAMELLATEGVLPNLWLGTSVEDQEAANERVPHLLRCPASVRWLSMEPLIGPVDLRKWLYVGPEGGIDFAYSRSQLINWIVLGGESGPKARPMHPDWARSIRDQCLAADVPLLVKQWGSWAPCDQIPEAVYREVCETATWREGPGSGFFHLGKKRSGRQLDGVTYDQYPDTPGL